MIRLSRNLQITAVVDALSIILLVFIPTDNQGFRNLSFSSTRLAMVLFLVLFLGFLIWSIKELYKNPEREQSIQQNLHDFMQKSRIGKSIQSISATVIMLVIIFSIGNTFLSNFQFRGIFLRLIPAFLLLVCLAIQILIFEPLRSAGGRWACLLFYSILYTIGGIIVQQFLLSQLGHAYKIPALVFMGNWLVTFLVSVILVSILSYLPKPELAVWRWMVILAGVLFVLQWCFYPRREWTTRLNLALYGNLLVISAVILTKIAVDLVTFLASRYQHKLKGYLMGGMGLILVMLAILFYHGASAHARIINTDLSESDQNAFIEFAKNARLLDFKYAGDFNRMPLYPFLLALTYHPGMSDQDFFAQSKTLSIILSLILLTVLLVIFARFFSIYQSFLLTTISAFSLFIYKAGYAKVELLYYFLAVLAFICMLQMLQKPGKVLSIATGVLLGLAYLSKASALLGLYLFIGVYLSMVFITIIRLLREKPTDRHKFVAPLQSISYICLTLLTFLAITYPYTRVAKQKFGHYFYNVNSTFYPWFDDFETAKQASLEYGFTQKWPDQLPQDEIPSLQKYLREHSAEQIIARVQFGVETQAHNLYHQYTFTNFILSYFVIFLISILVDLKNASSLVKRLPFVVGFSVIYILVHIASFAWYSSIAIGPRFTFGIFLPFMFSIFAGIKGMADNQDTASLEQRVNPSISKFSFAANVMMTGILTINIWLTLSGGILSGQFGS